jgi:hypothetical protein
MRIVRVLSLVIMMAIAGCHEGVHNNLPPSEMLMHPGPGVDGPGPGVMAYQPAMPLIGATSQVHFASPEGMTVRWDATMPGRFDSEPLVVPARQNFPQGAIYRLKLSNLPARPGVELYPTLEVGPSLPRTEAFLAHNAIPVQLTEEDFDQVLSGNFVTKVIYLPDPEFQELALAGVETLVSTRLEPGVDPIIEADRRGAILAILRLGNKDLQVPSAGAGEQGPEIAPMSYNMPMAGGRPCPAGGCPYPVGLPCGIPTHGGMTTMPPSFVAGVTAPQYGMPMSGTPIGLPGPPHVPLGVPAGLQRHTIVNHTCVNLPEPTRQMRIDVKQTPGMSYPAPANWACIHEETSKGACMFHQPMGDCREIIRPEGAACVGDMCPVGGPCPVSGGAPAGGGCSTGTNP